MVFVLVYFIVGFIVASLATKYRWTMSRSIAFVDDGYDFFMATLVWPIVISSVLAQKWINYLKREK